MCLCKADLPFSLRLRVEEGIRLCPSMIEDSSLGHWQLAMPFQNQKAACRIFMYVCMYVCMYVRIYVCMYAYIYIYMYIIVFVYIYMYVREPSCIV